MIPTDTEDINNFTNFLTDMKPCEDHQAGRTVMQKRMQCQCGSHHPHSSNL